MELLTHDVSIRKFNINRILFVLLESHFPLLVTHPYHRVHVSRLYYYAVMGNWHEFPVFYPSYIGNCIVLVRIALFLIYSWLLFHHRVIYLVILVWKRVVIWDNNYSLVHLSTYYIFISFFKVMLEDDVFFIP